eukprot:9131935-Pyramimonas_sp.AAC.1
MAQHTKWRRLSAPSGDSSARQVAIPHRSAARNERRRQRYDSDRSAPGYNGGSGTRVYNSVY